jgi:hypothetical protein
MPDSLPPIQGPASQPERDLDALLSGEAGYPTVVLGPVAGALAALRAAPSPDELDGEAAARAAFRLFMLPEPELADGAPAPASVLQGAAAGEGRLDGQNATVVLPMAAPSGPRHARPRRRLTGPGRWQVMTAVGGAAAAVIVCVAALAGAFSGPAGQQARSGHPSSTQSTSTSSKRPTSSVLGTATAHPTPRPSGSGQASSPEALCHQYMEFFTHPASRSTETTVVKQLSDLAGGWMRITGYCAKQLGAEDFPGGSGAPDSGHQSGHGGHGDSGGPRTDRAGSAYPLPGARSRPAGEIRTARTAR